MRVRLLMMRPRSASRGRDREGSVGSPCTPTSSDANNTGQRFFGSMTKRKSQSNITASKASTASRSSIKKSKSEQTLLHSSPAKIFIAGFVCIVAAVLAWDVSCYFGFGGKKTGNNSLVQNSTTNTGGWRLADDTTEKLYGTTVCNIDRRTLEELSSKEFENSYRYKKPLIVTFPNGARDWTQPDKWTVSSLKEEYGEWVVVSSNSRDIVRQGGSGRHQTSLTEFIDRLIRERDGIGEPYYVFDRDFYNDSSLPKTLKPPSYFHIKDGVDDSIFFLGSSQSGVTFHKHADSWNGVIYGKKHWFLYPVETTPPGGVYPGYTQLEWYQQIYPQLSESQRPLQCVQEAGEIMYLPEGIYHGTLNLGDTIAVGIQKKEASTAIEKLFYEENLVSKRIAAHGPKVNDLMKRKRKIFESLLELLPDNAEVHMKAGSMYEEHSMMEKAVHHTKRAIQLDKYFIVAILNLAGMYTKLEHLNDAEQLYQQAITMNPRLWDIYAKYGDFLVNHDRPEDAIPVYKKGAELEPQLMAFWKHLQIAQVRAGDKKGAKETQKQIERISSGN